MIYHRTVKDFGAVGDGVTDDTAAIQRAIDAAQAWAASGDYVRGASIILPATDSSYLISKPLIITGNNITMRGEPGATIEPNVIGPALCVHPPISSGNTMAVPTTSALVSGGPFAMVLGGSFGNNYLNLSDSPCSVIDGLSGFTAEFFIKLNSVSADGAIIGSHAKYVSSIAADTAFSLVVLSGGTLSVSMNISGSAKHFNSDTNYAINTLYHVALSFDGTTIRLFKNGVLDGSVTASGSVKQKLTEVFSIGPLLTQFPESGITYPPVDATAIDSIRISKVARYVAPFTPPTAKFVNDSNTLMLLNFDTQYDAFTVAQSNLGDNHLFYRSFPYNGVNANIFTIKDVWFDLGNYANGPLLYRAPNCQTRNTTMLNGWQGLYLLENCYVCRGSYITTYGQKRFSIALNLDCPGNWDNLQLEVSPYPFVAGDSSVNIVNSWIQSGGATIVPFTFKGNDSEANLSITNLTLVSEDGGQVQEYGVVVSSSIAQININGVYFQCPTNTLAAWVDTCASVAFSGCSFIVTGSAASAIHQSGSNGTVEQGTLNYFRDPAIPFSD